MEAILGGSILIGAAACWRWVNIDKQAIARNLALRLMAWDAGETARKLAKAEAMGKEINLT